MHIGLYAPAWPVGASPNGIVTYIAELKRGLEGLGHRVTVIHFPEERPPSLFSRAWQRLRAFGRTPEPLEPLVGGGRQVAELVRAMHRSDRFDIVEIEETFGWGCAVQAAIDVPVVVRLHGPHFLGKDAHESPEATARTAAREAAEGRAIAAARGLTSPSARLLAATLRHYGLVGRDARALFNPLQSPPRPVWSVEGSDPNLILCVGRFDWRKGADIVLQAFAIVARADPAATLAFVGPDRGLQLEPGRPLGFEAYCRDHLSPDVAARVHYKGSLSPSALEALRLQARVTVVGSRFETFSYAATEAMALGCPLIGTDIFGVGEVIVDGESGWLVPPENPVALARAMRAALDDPAECRRRGRLAWERARAAFDPARIAEETAAYYAEVIALN